MRGRQPETEEIRQLRRTWRNDRARPAIDGPDEPMPDPPAWLDGAGLEYWKATAPIVWEMGLLDESNVMLFAVLCNTAGMILDLQGIVKRDGATYLTPRGIERYTTAWRELKWSQKFFMQLSPDFGFTPRGRERMGLTWPKEKTTVSPLLEGRG